MGSTEFECTCGYRFQNSTDNRGYVGRLLADQDFEAFLVRDRQAIVRMHYEGSFASRDCQKPQRLAFDGLPELSANSSSDQPDDWSAVTDVGS